MNELLIDQLNIEASVGRKAEIAYVDFFKEYYADKTTELYGRFLNAETDEEALQVRGTLFALNELNDDLLLKIETGNIARQQLASIENGNG